MQFDILIKAIITSSLLLALMWEETKAQNTTMCFPGLPCTFNFTTEDTTSFYERAMASTSDTRLFYIIQDNSTAFSPYENDTSFMYIYSTPNISNNYLPYQQIAYYNHSNFNTQAHAGLSSTAGESLWFNVSLKKGDSTDDPDLNIIVIGYNESVVTFNPSEIVVAQLGNQNRVQSFNTYGTPTTIYPNYNQTFEFLNTDGSGRLVFVLNNAMATFNTTDIPGVTLAVYDGIGDIYEFNLLQMYNSLNSTLSNVVPNPTYGGSLTVIYKTPQSNGFRSDSNNIGFHFTVLYVDETGDDNPPPVTYPSNSASALSFTVIFFTMLAFSFVI